MIFFDARSSRWRLETTLPDGTEVNICFAIERREGRNLVDFGELDFDEATAGAKAFFTAAELGILAKEAEQFYENIVANLDADVNSAALVRAAADHDHGHAPFELPLDQAPPAVAEFMVALFLPQRRRDAVLGDLQERFEEDVNAIGLKRAKRRYWAASLHSIAPIAWATIKRVSLGAITFEWIRRG